MTLNRRWMGLRRRPGRRLGRSWGLAALLLGALLAANPRPVGAESPDPWRICGLLIEQAEQALDLPPHLLLAIATVESGRWNKADSALSAWPWTVMAEGRGRFLPSKAAAIAEVQKLKAKGVRNIDVGCMQINLQYHPRAFDDLEQAFDPAQNVAYGAAFLSQLRGDTTSWTRAVGRYHSATPKHSNRYRQKVYKAWRTAQRQAAEERRAARLAERAARRQQAAAGQIGPAAPPTRVD